ncbi:MAG TPA: DMT family transporter [Candidatus Nanoarchaeia archaeon]|nr:DMT family transporter [Candidatus Nanoarchaeia archaeon]
MLWLLFALIAAFFTGIAAILNKKVLLKEHALEFSTIFSLFTVAFSLPLLPWVDFSIPSSSMLLIIISGILGALGFLLIQKAMRHLEISTALPLLNLSPAAIAALSFFILGEGISSLQMAGLGLMVAGTYALEADHSLTRIAAPLRFLLSKYSLYLLLTVLLYSVTGIIERYLLTHGLDVYTYLFFAQIVILLFLLVLHIFLHDGVVGISRGFSRYGWWILVIAALLFLSRIFYFHALALAFVPLVVSLKRLSTLVAAIIGGRFFHERHLLTKTIAGAVILGGAFLIAL